MTERRLRALQERYAAAQARADRLRDERNAAVREALGQRGWTHQYVGDMLGVSRSRVHQMARRAPESDRDEHEAAPGGVRAPSRGLTTTTGGHISDGSSHHSR